MWLWEPPKPNWTIDIGNYLQDKLTAMASSKANCKWFGITIRIRQRLCVVHLRLRMIQASANRGSRLGAKTYVQGKPWPRLSTKKNLSVFQKKIEKNVEFLQFFIFTLCFRTFQAKKKFKIFFYQTDRKISTHHLFMLFFPYLNFLLHTRLIEKFLVPPIFDN